MKKAVIVLVLTVMLMAVAIIVLFCATASDNTTNATESTACERMHENPAITVDDIVSKSGTDDFIIKDINSWAILDPLMYMHREVVEINICDDTADTLCLFIELAQDEVPYVRKSAE